MSGQLRWPSLPCGVRLLQRSGARNVAAEAMRAPRRVIGRRCGLGGHGEPHDETRAGRNRRLGIEAMPHGHLAAAVEQVRLPVSEVLRIAVAREIRNRERVQRRGAVAGRIMRRTIEAMNERRLDRIVGQRINLSERRAGIVRFAIVKRERGRIVTARQTHREPLVVEPGERVGIASIGQADRRAQRLGIGVEPAQARLAGAHPGQQREALLRVRGKRDRPLAGWPHHSIQHAYRRRARVLRARPKRRGGVGGVRTQRERHTFEPCQPAACALDDPGAARRIGGHAPGREAGEPNRFVGPAAAQIVHQHAVAQREVQHAVVTGDEVGGTFRQREQNDLVGQMRARHGHGSDVAVGVRLLDPVCQAAVRVERARHALECAAGDREGGGNVGRRRQRAFARQPQHPAAAIPHRMAAGREVAPLCQQPEPRSIGVHQHSSGTTGTATASGSA